MSLEVFLPLIRRYQRKGLLVDSNVLLLFLVGSLDPKRIGDFKITANQGFTEPDFDILRTFIDNFHKIITTPHILTEVSNHAGKIKGAIHQIIFQKLITLVERLEECAEPTKSLVKSDAFIKFGLTDTAISFLAEKRYLVLTVDLPLGGHLQKRGADVVNFNHMRQLNWNE